MCVVILKQDLEPLKQNCHKELELEVEIFLFIVNERGDEPWLNIQVNNSIP